MIVKNVPHFIMDRKDGPLFYDKSGLRKAKGVLKCAFANGRYKEMTIWNTENTTF